MDNKSLNPQNEENTGLNSLTERSMVKLVNIGNNYPNKQAEEYPLTLSVMDVAEIMRIGRSKAYGLVKADDFPRIEVGNRIVIPRDTFFRWLDECATAKFAQR